MTNASDPLGRLITYIVNPFLGLVFAAGLLVFMFGLVEFMLKIEKGENADDGKQHMIYGLIGMLIMVSFYGIISLLSNTFSLGIDPHNPSSYNPDTSTVNAPAQASFTGQ